MNYRELDHEFDRFVKSVVELSHFKKQSKLQVNKQRRELAQQALKPLNLN